MGAPGGQVDRSLRLARLERDNSKQQRAKVNLALLKGYSNFIITCRVERGCSSGWIMALPRDT